MFGQLPGSQVTVPPIDGMVPDTSEQVHLSALSLLKMLRHGRAGVPMEVMGLMLGEFVDDYCIKVIDVFSMPQSGNSVSVEAVDPVYQTEMLQQLNRTGRPEMVVGWYHSHPGFGCWFSGTDVNTQQSFESLTPRAVGVVVDPIQSVRGKVIMDCFRLISPQYVVQGLEYRQTTSNVGHLEKPSVSAQVHGLNRTYYSIVVNCKKNQLENRMLIRLRKKKWNEALSLENYSTVAKKNADMAANLKELSATLAGNLVKNFNKDKNQLEVEKAGKIDVARRILTTADEIFERNIFQTVNSIFAISSCSA